MIVNCPECQARFEVDGSRVPATGARGRCTRCQAVFKVAPPENARPLLVGLDPEPSQATVDAVRKGTDLPRSAMPVGLDDPALTQKIDASKTLAGGPPRAMTYRSVVGDGGADAETGRDPGLTPESSRAAAAEVTADATRLMPSPLPPSTAAAAPGAMTLSPSSGEAGPGLAPVAGDDPTPTRRADGVMPQAEPTPGEVGPPHRRPFRVLESDGSESVLPKADVVRRIREGQLTEHDAVARQGEDFVGAGTMPELARYFELLRGGNADTPAEVPSERPPDPAVPRACAKHLDRAPGWQCAMCGAGLCQECITVTRAGLSELAVCTACGGAAREIAGLRDATPFWQDLPSIFSVCVRSFGWFMTAFYALLYWAAMLAFTLPMPGIFKGYLMVSGALVFLFLVTFDMLVLRAASSGSKKLPDWPEFQDWGEIFLKGLKGWLVYVAVHAPIVLFNLWLFGDALQIAMATGGARAVLGLGALFFLGNVVLLILAFAFYPMCFALVANFQSLRLALNPGAVIGSIRRILPEYLTLLAILFGIAFLSMGAQFILGALIPFLGMVFGALVHSYARLTSMHMVGRMVYQTEYKMGWDD